MLRFLKPQTLRHFGCLPRGLRIYAIGDVHGRADLLDALFSAIDKDLVDHPTRRSLHVCLGDYIDRGPYSRQVIDLIMHRSSIHEMVALKGNHEFYVIDFLRDPTTLTQWSQYGGLQTLMSYGLTPSIKPSAAQQRELANQFASALIEYGHTSFFGSLRTSYTCGDFFFVHAGVKPGVPLEGQVEEDLCSIRDPFLLFEENFPKLIVHGHTPVGDPDYRYNRINIDTGAYATGKLTSLIVEHNLVAVLTTGV